MTVSTVASRARAFDVRSKNNDSGVVIRMSAASRRKRARSLAGVSPVRMAMAGMVTETPCDCAIFTTPARGARRLRSTSTASAFSGET